MGRDDWYRNEQWNDEIEKAFYARLKRAKRKDEYLRIQAWMLSARFPEAALRMIDEFFALVPEGFDPASAWMVRAEAYLQLGKIDLALDAYEKALECEERHPNIKTQAYLQFSFLVARLRILSKFDRALQLLEANRCLMFPNEVFLWNASKAIILAARLEMDGARACARQALSAAAKTHSGLQYHSGIGLVGDSWQEIRNYLGTL